jgi:hypothetical protein
MHVVKVLADVFGLRHQLEIGDGVIRLVSVDVMDNLARNELSANFLLHDNAMLQAFSIRRPDGHIAVNAQSTPTFPSWVAVSGENAFALLRGTT